MACSPRIRACSPRIFVKLVGSMAQGGKFDFNEHRRSDFHYEIEY